MGLLWLKQRERSQFMPLPKARDKVNLKEVGAEEFYIEFKLLQGLAYAEVREMWAENEDDDYERLKDMFAKLITDWNIPEVDGGDPLPIPSKSRNVVDKLPLSYVNFISTQLSADDSLEVTSNL